MITFFWFLFGVTGTIITGLVYVAKKMLDCYSEHYKEYDA